MGLVAAAVDALAVMSGETSCQLVSVSVFLYCKRYVWPTVELQIIVATPFAVVIDSIRKGQPNVRLALLVSGPPHTPLTTTL